MNDISVDGLRARLCARLQQVIGRPEVEAK
jgi:hypothetical protein